MIISLSEHIRCKKINVISRRSCGFGNAKVVFTESSHFHFNVFFKWKIQGWEKLCLFIGYCQSPSSAASLEGEVSLNLYSRPLSFLISVPGSPWQARYNQTPDPQGCKTQLNWVFLGKKRPSFIFWKKYVTGSLIFHVLQASYLLGLILKTFFS